MPIPLKFVGSVSTRLSVRFLAPKRRVGLLLRQREDLEFACLVRVATKTGIARLPE